jgi:hypothetical protein
VCYLSDFLNLLFHFSLHFSLVVRYRYAIPISVAFMAYMLRWMADWTCSPYSQMCRNTSEFLSHIYAVVVCFLVIIVMTKAKQVKELFDRLKGAIQLVINDSSGKQKND